MESQPRSRVVVGIDGTSAGPSGSRLRRDRGGATGAELLLVHAHHFPAMPTPPFPPSTTSAFVTTAASHWRPPRPMLGWRATPVRSRPS